MAAFALPATYADAALRRKSPPVAPQTIASPRLSCATLKQTSTNITARVLAGEKTFNKNNDAALQKLVAAQNKQSDLLSAQRANQDKLKKNTYAKLDAVAKTDAQKQAVTEFKAAADRAENARRETLDEATNAFRASTQNILSERKQAGQTAVTEFKDKIAGYIKNAETDCNSGTINPIMTRSALRTNSLTAQNKLISQRRTINQNAKSSLNTLIQTHKEARQKAADDFKAAMQNAAANLKQDFK